MFSIMYMVRNKATMHGSSSRCSGMSSLLFFFNSFVVEHLFRHPNYVSIFGLIIVSSYTCSKNSMVLEIGLCSLVKTYQH
jgi:hypothetical protein